MAHSTVLLAAVLAALAGCAPPAPPPPVPPDAEASRAGQEPPPPEETKPRQAAEADRPVTFAGHTDAIHCVAFSPDRSRIVTLSRDCTARVWDARTGRELSQVLTPITGARPAVWSASFSPDGRQVLARPTFSGDIYVWEANTGRNLLRLPVYWDVSRYPASHFSADGQTVVAETRPSPTTTPVLFRVWDAQTGRLLRELPELDDDTRVPEGLSLCSQGPKRVLACDGRGGKVCSGDGKRTVTSDGRGALISDVVTKKLLVSVIGNSVYPAGQEIRTERAGPGALHARACGVAMSDDGKFVLLLVRFYQIAWTQGGTSIDSQGGMRPVHPISYEVTVSYDHVLLNVDAGKEVRRTPAPEEWKENGHYFFRDTRPYVLVPNDDGTTLKLVEVFPSR
jgi:hypothetical protein